MASTVLPNGIIIPEKYSRDWYNDLYHNWQELDNLLGASGPGDGTLTIQKNGDTVGTFSANQSTNETINITVPDVNDATLTIQQNGTTVDTFTANSSTDKTVNISVPTKTSDLTNDSGFITSDNTKIPLAGSNAISGSLIPSTDNSIDIGSSAKNIKALYTKGITIDGKTVDTDANGNMTFDSHKVDTIEEQGDGYIRYSNGIQICYGEVVNDNNIERGKARFSFPKAFSASPSLVATPNNRFFYTVTGEVESGTTWILSIFQLWGYPNIGPIEDPLHVNYVAIGKWN